MKTVINFRIPAALTCLTLFIVVAPMSAQKIKVQYNKEDDFSVYKTYDWIKKESYARPMLAMDVIGAVDGDLQAKGLTKVDANPDLIVAAYGSFDAGLNVSFVTDVYVMPPLDGPIWWGGTAVVSSTSTGVYIAKGTLVIDIVDRRTKKLKWRGIAKANLDPNNPNKALEVVNRAIDKMIHDYPAGNK